MSNASTQNNSLTSRVLAAGSWTIFGYGTAQVLRLVSNLIMTRLLVPEMFGLMAATQTFLFIVALVSDLGVNLSVIQSKRGEDKMFLNTAWTLQVIRGAILMGALCLVALGVDAAAIAGLFNDDSAYAQDAFPSVLMAVATTLFISGFTSTNAILADRRMQIGRITLLALATQIFGLVVMISWAYFYDASVWALVAGSIVNSAGYVLMTHILISGERNRFVFEKEAFLEIFHFGKWVVLSSAISAFYFQADKLFIGYQESAAVLGIYSIAFFIVTAARDLMLHIISKVFFPMLSEVSRENREKLVEYYYRIRMRTDALTIFCSGLLFACAGPIITILYDDRYLPAIPMLKTLAFTLLFTAPFVSRVLMLSIGDSKYMASIRAVQLVTVIISMPLLYSQLGVLGVIWSIVLSQFIALIFDLYYRGKRNALRFLHDIKMYPMIVLGYFCGLACNQLGAALGLY